MASFDALGSDGLDPGAVDPAVRRFYERTSEYRLSVAAEWSRSFRVFGWALAALFQQAPRSAQRAAVGAVDERGHDELGVGPRGPSHRPGALHRVGSAQPDLG
jgi:hypothetical protein